LRAAPAKRTWSASLSYRSLGIESVVLVNSSARALCVWQ
jgi:hypothetical protein